MHLKLIRKLLEICKNWNRKVEKNTPDINMVGISYIKLFNFTHSVIFVVIYADEWNHNVNTLL